MKTGCVIQQVASATLNCICSWSAGRSQARRQPACSRVRTVDGEVARKLSPHSDTQLNYQPRGLKLSVRSSSCFYTAIKREFSEHEILTETIAPVHCSRARENPERHRQIKC